MTMDTFPSVGLVKVKQLEKPQEMSKVFIKMTKQTKENQHNLRFADSIRYCASVCLRSYADVQRGLPDPRQCGHGHGLPVRREDQPEHHRR